VVISQGDWNIDAIFFYIVFYIIKFKVTKFRRSNLYLGENQAT
jgi:hypothetical protein